MNKYRVFLEDWTVWAVEVSANDEDEAKEKALETDANEWDLKEGSVEAMDDVKILECSLPEPDGE